MESLEVRIRPVMSKSFDIVSGFPIFMDISVMEVEVSTTEREYSLILLAIVSVVALISVEMVLF